LFWVFFQVVGSSGMLPGFLRYIVCEHDLQGPLSVFKGSATAFIAVVRPFSLIPILPPHPVFV
jgi:hypothetical protein